jgi:hypothetical protein
MEDVFNIEIQKSDYSNGGGVGYSKKERVIDYYYQNDVFDDYETYGLSEDDLDNEDKIVNAIIKYHGLNNPENVEERFETLGLEDSYEGGGNVVAYKYYDKDDYDDSVTIIKPDELQAFLDDWNNTMETNYKTAKEFNSSEDYYVIEEIYYGGGETITKPKPRITPTETPTKPDKGNPYAPKVKPFPKADYLISNK